MRGGMRNEVLDEIYEQYSTVCEWRKLRFPASLSE